MRPADKQLQEYLQMHKDLLEKIGKGETPKGFAYMSQYHFILKHGRFFNPEPLKSHEQLILKKALKRINFVPQKKQCFYNAQMLALTDNSGQIKYCEGFALKIIPANHAWIEINGKVVDVTWADKEGKNFHGTFPDDIAYLGFNMSKNDIMKQFKTGLACSFLDDFNDGFQLLKKPFNG
jgi:hypothetical protein